jgi:hypothetical protein
MAGMVLFEEIFMELKRISLKGFEIYGYFSR